MTYFTIYLTTIIIFIKLRNIFICIQEASPEAGPETSSERGQITPSGSQPETLVAHSDVTSEELLHISSTTATLRSNFTNV